MSKKSFWLVMGFCAMLVLQLPSVFAKEEHPGGHSGHVGGHSGHVGGHSGHVGGHSGHVGGHSGHVGGHWGGHPGKGYYWRGGHWRGGRWYGPGWFWLDVAPVLIIGAVVEGLPYGYTTIIVAGVPYYYYDGVYYETCPSGYVIVPAPVVSSAETIIINVPNSDGSYTPVKLIKRDNGYVGPQGEYYPGNPTVEELKALYGK